MKLHDVIQGSPEWLAQRLNTYNASDAPAMLGCSPYETRSQLISRLATGIVPEVDAATQRRFDDGHRFEALARPLAEAIIGEDLYPVSGSEDFGLDKPLAASLDGSTITDEIVWEHKSLNDELRAMLPEQIVGEVFVGSVALGAKLPKLYRVQMEQQLMITKASKVLFTASKWNSDDTLVEARHCWYQSDPALRAEILGGWKQLSEDVKAYVPPSASALEKIVAEPVEALPAPVVRVAGQITLVDNFKAFEERLREFLATKLIREPKTDEDFVNLDSQIKAMKSARESLKAAESQMLAQVQPVDQAKKTKDMLDTLLQQNVSMAEKIMTAEKERRKGEIVAVGVKGLADHIAALNERLGKPYMPAIPADFGGAVKGLKSMSSMEDKVATELARAKIAASELADRLQKNLDYLRDNAADFKFLFADTATIIQKAPDDLQALVQNRITQHKAEEAAKEERIREEAAAKARQKLLDEQAAAQKAEDALISSIWANARRIEGNSVGYIQKAIGMFETAAKDFENDLRPRVVAAITEARAEMTAKLEAAEQATTAPAVAAALTDALVTGTGVLKQTADTSGMTLTHVPAAALRVNPVPAAANDDAVINVGEINDRIKPLQISAAGLQELGFQPVPRKGVGVFFRESDYPRMCEALIQHLTEVADVQVAA